MPTFTDQEIDKALFALQQAHLDAQAEVRQAVSAATIVSQTLLQASRGESHFTMARCERCGLAFIPVPCADDTSHAHCPDGNCGEPFDLTDLAAQNVSPTSGTCSEADGSLAARDNPA